MDGLAGYEGAVNAKISGSELISSLESNLDLLNFTTLPVTALWGQVLTVDVAGTGVEWVAPAWTKDTGGIYYNSSGVSINNNNPDVTIPLKITGTGADSGSTAVTVMDSASSTWFELRDDKRIVYTDGNEGYNRVLTSDASGVATWQTPGLPKMFGYFQGVMPNPGSVGHAQEQVIWSDPIALSTEFGVMIIPFDCKITKVTLKWVGDTAPTIDIGDGTTSWQIGKLTSVTGTTDTTGGTNFTDLTPASTGAGSWEDLDISNANGDSGTFVYKLWNATVLLNAPVQFSADEMLVFRITRGGASWSETSDDITVNLKFQYT